MLEHLSPIPPKPAPPAPLEEAKRFDVQKPFWGDLGELVRYPCQGRALIALLAGGGVLAALQVVSTFLISKATTMEPAVVYVTVLGFGALAGYANLYLREIIRQSSRAVAEPPDWPLIEVHWDDLVVPLLKMLASFSICYGVALACWLAGAPVVVPLFFVALGTLYFPMSLLILSVLGRVLPAIDPRNVVAAILKVCREYLVVLAFIFGAATIGILAHAYLSQLLYPLGVFLSWPLTVYLVLLTAHILGRLYALCREEKLGPLFLALVKGTSVE